MELPDVLPLFPLPDHVLLLGLPVPYRVFEPRYRALVDDLLGQSPDRRLLAIPRLAEGWQSDYYGRPAIMPCAAVARALNIRPLDGGQFLLVVEGLMRCDLSEAPSERPYRLASASPRSEHPADPTSLDTAMGVLLQRVNLLIRSLGERGQGLARIIDEYVDPVVLVDRLGAAMLRPVVKRQAFLECNCVLGRIATLRQTLDEALGHLPRPRWEPSPN